MAQPISVIKVLYNNIYLYNNVMLYSKYMNKIAALELTNVQQNPHNLYYLLDIELVVSRYIYGHTDLLWY